MILYLHGFRSSPSSANAQALRAHMAARGQIDRFWCEQLPVDPDEVMALIARTVSACPEPATLVGSALGGVYAAAAAERHGLSAILINPAVLSAFDLEPYIGVQANFHTGESFQLSGHHVAGLRELDAHPITRPERYWLMVETGDEVLDYRAAVARYPLARQTVLEGGDHSFTRFAVYLDEILAFGTEAKTRGAV